MSKDRDQVQYITYGPGNLSRNHKAGSQTIPPSLPKSPNPPISSNASYVASPSPKIRTDVCPPSRNSPSRLPRLMTQTKSKVSQSPQTTPLGKPSHASNENLTPSAETGTLPPPGVQKHFIGCREEAGPGVSVPELWKCAPLNLLFRRFVDN
jgi:hypothetical protein